MREISRIRWTQAHPGIAPRVRRCTARRAARPPPGESPATANAAGPRQAEVGAWQPAVETDGRRRRRVERNKHHNRLSLPPRRPCSAGEQPRQVADARGLLQPAGLLEDDTPSGEESLSTTVVPSLPGRIAFTERATERPRASAGGCRGRRRVRISAWASASMRLRSSRSRDVRFQRLGALAQRRLDISFLSRRVASMAATRRLEQPGCAAR